MSMLAKLALAGVASLAAATDLKLTWKDCGGASTHGKITGLTPASTTLGQKTTVVGTGTVDEDVSGGSYQVVVKALGVTLLTHKGDLCSPDSFSLPLNTGSISWAGLTCPNSKGATSISMDVTLSASLPSQLDSTTIELTGTSSSGDQLICVTVQTSKESNLARNAEIIERAQYHSREDWTVKALAQGWESHEVMFAVKQQNLDKLHDVLMEVSLPNSPKRGQYLSYTEAHQLTANPEGSRSVINWLAGEPGVSISRIQKHGHYVRARSNISTWERLFNTKFAHFVSAHDGAQVVLRAIADVTVPHQYSDHVAGVFMTTQLPPRPRKQTSPRFLGDLPEVNASGAVTPAGLQSFYHVSGTGSSSVSQAVFESLGQYVSPSDLTVFQNKYNLPQEAIAKDIGGHESAVMCSSNPNNCAEANLDVQYMMAISQGTPETFWYESNQNTPFESWIEAVSSTSNPPLIHSISYGALEPEMSSSVVDTFNTEAMKLGTQGVTIFVSTGDDGVANFQARGDAAKCAYTPSFPATSPYVTAVGATQGGVNGGAEVACSANTGGSITTGGGFSTKFNAPSWQKDAISKYFATVSPAPESGYASSGRGYPDVSMAGFDYEVVISGSLYGVSGTSASSPVVAAMASLVNAKMSSNGKSSIGFINPTLYSAGVASFNDITQGNNKCTASTACCGQGFYSTAGWDPVTGWGSVDYAKFESLFLSSHGEEVVV